MLLRIATVLHVLAAAVYVGGSVFLELVFGPSQDSIPPSQASVIGQKVGIRFAVLAWISLLIIGLSGACQLYAKGLLNPLLFTTRVGIWTLSMIGLWVLLAINGAVMTLGIRPRLEKRLSLPVTPEIGVRRLEELGLVSRRLDRLVRLNTALATIALIIGASLRYGGLF
jgi:uncharacterized membrane protein